MDVDEGLAQNIGYSPTVHACLKSMISTVPKSHELLLLSFLSIIMLDLFGYKTIGFLSKII